MSIPVISGSSTAPWKSLINTVIGFINTAFASRPYVWADSTARLAQTGMTVGDMGRQTDTQVTYRATGATTAVPWSSPWIAYTSTLTNITLGTGGTQALRYRYEFGTVRVRGPITLGSSGVAVGTAPTMTLPVNTAAVVHANDPFPGRPSAYDASAITNFGLQIIRSSSSTSIAVIQTASSNAGAPANVTATVPFTWAITDVFDIDLTYEPA